LLAGETRRDSGEDKRDFAELLKRGSAGVRAAEKTMTGVPQIGAEPATYSVEGADAVI